MFATSCHRPRRLSIEPLHAEVFHTEARNSTLLTARGGATLKEAWVSANSRRLDNPTPFPFDANSPRRKSPQHETASCFETVVAPTGYSKRDKNRSARMGICLPVTISRFQALSSAVVAPSEQFSRNQGSVTRNLLVACSESRTVQFFRSTRSPERDACQ